MEARQGDRVPDSPVMPSTFSLGNASLLALSPSANTDHVPQCRVGTPPYRISPRHSAVFCNIKVQNGPCWVPCFDRSLRSCSRHLKGYTERLRVALSR